MRLRGCCFLFLFSFCDLQICGKEEHPVWTRVRWRTAHGRQIATDKAPSFHNWVASNDQASTFVLKIFSWLFRDFCRKVQAFFRAYKTFTLSYNACPFSSASKNPNLFVFTILTFSKDLLLLQEKNLYSLVFCFATSITWLVSPNSHFFLGFSWSGFDRPPSFSDYFLPVPDCSTILPKWPFFLTGRGFLIFPGLGTLTDVFLAHGGIALFEVPTWQSHLDNIRNQQQVTTQWDLSADRANFLDNFAFDMTMHSPQNGWLQRILILEVMTTVGRSIRKKVQSTNIIRASFFLWPVWRLQHETSRFGTNKHEFLTFFSHVEN